MIINTQIISEGKKKRIIISCVLCCCCCCRKKKDPDADDLSCGEGELLMSGQGDLMKAGSCDGQSQFGAVQQPYDNGGP